MDSDLQVAQYPREGLILDEMLLVLGHDFNHIVAPSYNQITKVRKGKTNPTNVVKCLPHLEENKSHLPVEFDKITLA